MNAFPNYENNLPTSLCLKKRRLSVDSITLQDVAYWLSIALIFVFATRDFVGALSPSLPLNLLMYVLSASIIFLGILSLRMANIYAIACVLFIEMAALGSCAWSSSFMQREYVAQIFFDIASMLNISVFLIAFARVEKPDRLRGHLLVLSIVCMAIIIAATLSGNYSSDGRDLNYLGVGIGSIIWVSFMIQASFTCRGVRRAVFACMSVICTLFVALYGNRGALVGILVFAVFSLVRYTNARHKVSIAIALLLGVALLSVFGAEMYSTILLFVNDLGIYSRNLTLSLSDSLLDSTHRDTIWLECIRAFDGHWLFGYGFAYDRVLGGAYNVYAHNIVLELCLIAGVIPGVLLFLAHMAIGLWMCFRCDSDAWSQVYAPFFISSTTVLMFNSSLLTLSIFWGSYGLLFAYLRSRKMQRCHGRIRGMSQV